MKDLNGILFRLSVAEDQQGMGTMHVVHYVSDVQKLLQRIETLESALKVYAYERNWSTCGFNNEECAFDGYEEDVYAHDGDPWYFAQTVLAEDDDE